MGNVYHHHGRMGLASCPARYFNNDPEIECVPFASGWMCRNSDDVSVSINHQLTRMEFGDPVSISNFLAGSEFRHPSSLSSNIYVCGKERERPQPGRQSV